MARTPAGAPAQARSKLIDRIQRVDLRVTDVERSLGFYRDVAGFQVLERTDSSALVGDAAGTAFLSLTSEGVTKPASRSAAGLFHTAFRYPTRRALGHALARLVKANYEVGAGDHFVSEALYVDDPDGNGVELYHDRPRKEWPEPPEGQLVAMGTVAVDLRGLLDEATVDGIVEEAAPGGTDVGHVHLQIADVDETVAFYVDILGLDLMARMGSQAAFLASNGYHHHIGANTWHSRGQAPAPRDQAGIDRIVFATAADELQALVHRLEASGRHYSRVAGEIVIQDPNDVELRFAG
jgi:catechol 2,3-dioxygenase